MYRHGKLELMRRRRVLATVAGVTVAGLAGCVAGGRVVHEQQRSVTVPPGRGWVFEITDAEGNSAVSYTVGADRRFDVYYFTSAQAYDVYREVVGSDGDPDRDPEEVPSGHGSLSRVAVQSGEEDTFEAAVPEDGGRQPISIEGRHYFVVDHSNYGIGVPVGEHDDPLDAFVDLTVYEKTLPV